MAKKIAIVGFGFMGRTHYAGWKEIKGAKIVALCDKDLSQFETVVTGDGDKKVDTSLDYGDAKLYDDMGKMLEAEKPDIVDITLPTWLHLPLVEQAFKSGANVICEKPMSLDVASCQKMIKAWKASGKHFMIAQCLRFWPEYVYLKSLIDSEKYGKVVAASFRRFNISPGWGKNGSWFLNEEKSGGVALDLHIHDTDMVQFLFGTPKAVTSRATYTEDGAMRYISTIYDVGGPTVIGEGSWGQPPSFGFEATFMVSFEKATVVLDAKRAVPLMVYPMKGEPFQPKLSAKTGYQLELEWFFKLVSGKKVPEVTTPEACADSVRIVAAEKKSAKTQKTVKL